MTAELPFPTALPIAAAIAGAILIVLAVSRLVACVRASVLVRLPAIAEQDVTFAEAGNVVLCIEQPQFRGALSGVDFALRDASGRDVPSAPVLFRTKVAGFSRVRLSVRAFALASAGRYRLIASGIAPGRGAADAAIVFTRPFAATMVFWILAIVLGGFALIGGVVFASLRFAGQL